MLLDTDMYFVKLENRAMHLGLKTSDKNHKSLNTPTAWGIEPDFTDFAFKIRSS